MTDSQIETMLQMHRFLICSEIKQAFYQINQDDNAAELQKQKNDEEWEKFAQWLKVIRDD